MEEVVIDIAEHLKADVRRISILREHHLLELQKLGAELRQLLRIGHGVDIAEPGWDLDAENGKLRHAVPAAPEPEQKQEG